MNGVIGKYLCWILVGLASTSVSFAHNVVV